MTDKVFYILRTDAPYFKYLLQKIGMSEHRAINYQKNSIICEFNKVIISIVYTQLDINFGYMEYNIGNKKYLLDNKYEQHKVKLTDKELEEIEFIENINLYNL